MDFSKAFDKVNYWKLFNKLLDDNIAVKLATVLAYWYSHQQNICALEDGAFWTIFISWAMASDKAVYFHHICFLVTYVNY